METGLGKEVAILFEKNDLVDKRWLVKKLIGKGDAGAVFEVTDRKTNQQLAMKVECSALGFNFLKVEAAALKALKQRRAKHACELFGAAKMDAYNYIVMTLLGPTLSDHLASLYENFPDGKPRFNLYTCIHVAKHSLEATKEVHQCGLLHRDVNPRNFATGLAPKIESIFIFDFGLCRRYRNKDGSIVPARSKPEYRGTQMYSSVNSLRCQEQSRIDDVWSWLFMVIRMTNGPLPWEKWTPPKEATFTKQLELLADVKDNAINNVKVFTVSCPEEYEQILNSIKGLGYHDIPPYAKIQELLASIMKKLGNQGYKLDWE